MNPTEPKSHSEKLVIHWGYNIPDDAIEAIRKRFNIPHYTTLNGFSPAEISDEDMPIFEETARRGFFSILRVKWCKNGGVYSF